MPTHDYAHEPRDTHQAPRPHEVRAVQGNVARPIPVVRPQGDLDSESLWPLSQALNAAVGAGSAVVLDASGITFGDSSFLRVLLDVHHRADLRLAAVPESLGRVLRLVGLDLTLRIYPTVEDAQVTGATVPEAREGTVNAP